MGLLRQSMHRSLRAKPILVAGALLVVVLFMFAWGGGPRSSFGGLPTSGTVAAVLDGDTVQLQSGERVRYLGLDAPEVEHNGNSADCFAVEATRANRELVLHKRVSLQYDHETTDRYGRLLAYVRLSDGRSVNGELIRGGYAHVFRTSDGFSRFDEFVALQREAIREHRGMWSACNERPARSYVANLRTGVFHRAGCPFGRSASVRNAIHFETRWAPLLEGFSPCRRCKP